MTVNATDYDDETATLSPNGTNVETGASIHSGIITVGSTPTDGSDQSLTVNVIDDTGNAAVRTIKVSGVTVDTKAPEITSVSRARGPRR